MALWVDKYRPRELNKMSFHKDQAAQLKSLCSQGDFPHLLFYGPSGSGKKTRIMALLRELYGPGVEKLKNETIHFTTPSNRKLEIMTVGSNYHIEVNPSDAGIYDRVVVTDMIKQMAQTQQIDPQGQREFKTIVLSEVDELTKDAQHALRRTMEKYIATCRLILCVNSTSRVIPAVKSRCLAVRVAAPNENEIVSVLDYVAKKEGIDLPKEFAKRIAVKSERNLRRAILMMQACKVQQYPFSVNQDIPTLDWQAYLKETATQILHEQTPQNLEKVRERLYELIGHGIPSDIIFKGLVEYLNRHSDTSMRARVLSFASLYEYRMHSGSKAIFHLEAFVAQFMATYKNFVQSNLMDLDDD